MSCISPLDDAWNDIQNIFGLGGQPLASRSTVSASTLGTLQKENICRQVLDYLQAEVEHRLRTEIVPAFWSHFKSPAKDDNSTVIVADQAQVFQKAVNDLYLRVCSLSEFISRMDQLSKDAHCPVSLFNLETYEAVFKVFLRGTLYSQLPPHHEEPIHAFYSRAFNVFHARKNKIRPQASEFEEGGMDDEEEEDDDEEEMCKGCLKEKDNCECNSIIAIFHDTNQKLLFLDLLERLTSNVVTQLINSQIQSHVQYTCQGSFTVSHLRNLEVWLDVIVMAWIRFLFSASTTGLATDAETLHLMKTFNHRLCHYLYEVYTKARIDQLFNIIIEFPDSQPALEDLKECLAKTDLRPVFVKSLKAILQQKLLHLGVNTADILTAYITAIRALRFLDPSGILLELVCEPVRKYLRTRDDTVRCIVQSLIDDSSNELSEELMKSDRLYPDEALVAGLGDVDLDASELVDTWQDWRPDPIDADPSRSASSLNRRSSDIISMLVNIYGSKDLFVNEYRSMLSNRLLSQFSYNTEKEIRNLELLKLRFGESAMQQCEVMLKDISDSKRINNAISGSGEEGQEADFRLPFPVNALILSGQFWPQFKDQEDLELPEEVLESLDCYGKAFETLKKIRTLVWKPHLGFANLDLQIGDKHLNVTVSPAQAAIINLFQDKAEWSANELSLALKMPVSTLQRKIAFWQTQGLIKEAPGDVYVLVEEGPMRRMSGHVASVEDDESESLVRTSSDQRAEELQVFWSYIINMLINLESLPLDRIFQMLKMFAMQGQSSAVECDINQLRSFLDEKVRQHELLFSGGNYKLPKN